jgi:hypothetical protein
LIGHLTALHSLDAVPAGEWETLNVCGVWSTREIVAHLASFEQLLMMKTVRAMGYLMHFDWGCKSGHHIGWAVIEAENTEQALLVVPSNVRSHARIIRVDRWGPEDFR